MFDKANPKPGTYDISNDDYHSSPGISRSQLMYLRESPHHFWYFYLNPKGEPRAETDAMKFGSAFHTYVLEHQHFESRYIVATKPKGEGMMAAKARILSDAKLRNKTVLWQDEFAKLQVIADAIRANPKIKPLLDQPLAIEQAMYWNEPETGLLVKCKPDAIANTMVLDLKSAASAKFYKFRSASYDGGYHIQAAMIREAFQILFDIDLTAFILLAAEKKAPYMSVPYPMSAELMDRGEVEYKQLMHQLMECYETNQWPGYEPELLTMPNYVRGD